jgi:REP element-mobilizing transposase RayT
MPPTPIYTADDVSVHYELQWAFTLFWKTAPGTDSWLPELSELTEADGVRILQHRFSQPNCSLFLTSTQPQISPATISWSIKGRLQRMVRPTYPVAFQRNYDLRSAGSTSREKVESYVAAQATHHLSDNSSLCALFSDLAMLNSDIDLSKARFTAHARYWANLHLVFVHNWRQAITDPDIWIGIRKMLRRASQSKGHLLSRAGFVPDHLHFTIGIHPSESPLEVALSYMNNLAWVHNQKAIFMPSFYVATFGEYDLGAIHPATGPAPVADDGMGLL